MGTKKHISNEILIQIGRAVLVVFLAVAIVIVFMTRTAMMRAKQTELTLESESASNKLSDFFDFYIGITKQMAVNPQIQQLLMIASEGDVLTEMEEYPTIFENLVNIAGIDPENILAAWVADIDANMLTQSDSFTSGEGWDFYDRAWAYCTEIGETILTEPYIDSSTGGIILSTAAPVYTPDGSQVLGAAGLDFTLSHMSEVMEDYKMGKNGSIMLFSASGSILYDKDESRIQQNITETDLSQNVIDAISNGTNGFFKYKSAGGTKYGNVSSVGDTGYSVLSCLPSMEYYSELIQMIAALIIVFTAGIILIIYNIRKTAENLTRPIIELDQAAQQLAAGNLDVELNITAQNEIGELGQNIRATVDRLKEYIDYIDEIAQVLTQIADGKLSFELKNEYIGEFMKIKDALLHISASMTGILSSINHSANQVAAGADDLAHAALVLADGTGAQAVAVEQLVATSTIVLEQVQDSRNKFAVSATETQKVAALMEQSRQQMLKMFDAMDKIQETSNQVVGIITTIEEIADQTNLLSLNASIEAARAGEAGRGFAVVADEIGKLADASSKAANTTRDMINVSIEQIKNGNDLAGDVMSSMQDTVEAIDDVKTLIQDAADNATLQAQSIDYICIGISEISKAIQDSSATAEESSSTSEQLAAQSASLNELVQQFKLDS